MESDSPVAPVNCRKYCPFVDEVKAFVQLCLGISFLK